MNFLCTCISELFDKLCAGCASDYRVVNKHYSLALNFIAEGVKLYLNRSFTLFLRCLNERSADVSVLY